MVENPESGQVRHPVDIVHQAVLVGGAAAIPGTVVGAFAGTLRTSTPVLFSLVSGLQWFAIGSTFWTVRSSILQQAELRNWWNLTRGAPLGPISSAPPSRSQKVRASAVSGGITGAILGALFRGPRNVVPGTIMFSLFGYGGQHLYELLDQRNSQMIKEEVERRQEGKERENWLQKVAKNTWSPMSVLTDEEYERLISERLLRVKAEIALIDERLNEFRKQQLMGIASEANQEREQGKK